MEISRYKLEAIGSHLRRIVLNAKANPAGHSTADALRLARRDLRWIEKILKDNDTTDDKGL